MIEANKYKLGVFVLTGIGLLIIGLFMLGLSESLKSKINFMTYFNESVQGLETGSAVKFRGVSIGKVTRIAIRPEDNFIRVDMQALPSSIQPTRPGAKPVDFFNQLEQEVNKGLRCRMELKGITGMKYVEMDYTDPKKSTILGVAPPVGSLYIPSTPSLLAGLRTNVTVAIAKIAKIDYEKISQEMASALKSANEIFSDPKITAMIDKADKVTSNMEKITANFEKSFNASRMEAISKDLKDSLIAVKAFSKKAETELTGAKIPDTTKSIREIKGELSITLDKMDKTLDAMTELINSIDQDPSSLIRGKQSPKEF
jgi:paraquat-inducible protein B